MPRVEKLLVGGFLMLAPPAIAATVPRIAAAQRSVVRREIVAIYFGTIGTDSMFMMPIVRNMKTGLARQASESGRRVIVRGVSLEPSVEASARHLGYFGIFDEESLGGNWTNPEVVRYLGPNFDTTRTSGIPQVVVVERQVTDYRYRLEVGPEREIARFVGTKDVEDWVHRGAPLPR